MWRQLLLCWMLFLAATGALSNAIAADVLDEYSMILVPVASGGAGAHGSQWDASLWMLIDSDLPIRVGPFNQLGPPPPGTLPPPPLVPLPLRTIFVAPVGRAWRPNPAVLLYVHEDEIAALHLQLRLRNDLSVVANLPTVLESEFRRGTVNLLPIDYSAGKRVNLRLYGLPGTTTTFRVRLLTADSFVLFEQQVRLDLYDEVELFRDQLVPVRPSFAELPLPYIDAPGARRIEIVPLENDFAYWAMATVTDNVTQAVEVFTSEP